MTIRLDVNIVYHTSHGSSYLCDQMPSVCEKNTVHFLEILISAYSTGEYTIRFIMRFMCGVYHMFLEICDYGIRGYNERQKTKCCGHSTCHQYILINPNLINDDRYVQLSELNILFFFLVILLTFCEPVLPRKIVSHV